MSLTDFTAKWAATTRTERAASQEHFIDLCRLLGQPTPNEADPTGDFYAFEKGTAKTGGGEGLSAYWTITVPAMPLSRCCRQKN